MKWKTPIKHGHSTRESRSATYGSWCAMHQRCKYPGSGSFERYGGIGITVCERWNAFEAFLADMGERPEGMTLDRIDSAGNYEPGNCRWATTSDQARNTKRAVKVGDKCLANISEETGIKYATLYKRLKQPMPTMPRAGNSSGYRGVSPYRGKWRATISTDRKQSTLGVFDTPEEAHAAYLAAAKEKRAVMPLTRALRSHGLQGKGD